MAFFVDKYKVSRELARPPPDWAAQAKLQGTAATDEQEMFALKELRNVIILQHYDRRYRITYWISPSCLAVERTRTRGLCLGLV